MILIFIFILFFTPSIDPDLGWYIRGAGENLTYFLPDYRFENPYSLYSYLAGIIWNTLGHLGFALVYALLMVFAFYLVQRIYPRAKTIAPASLLIALTPLYSYFILGLRSQIITFVGLVVCYFLVLTDRSLKKSIVITFLLFAIWANMHGGFPIGLVVILVSILINRKNIYLLLAGFAGSLINPYGLSLYLWTLKHFTIPLNTMIAEWTPPNIFIQIVIFCISFLTFVILISTRHKRRLFWLILLVIFTYLALRANRNLALYNLTVVLIIIDLSYNRLQKIGNQPGFPKLANLLTALLIVIVGYFSLSRSIPLIFDEKAYCNQIQKYPCEAIKYLKENPLGINNVFAPYEWGGFLEWKLPEYKYFSDGRMVVWQSPEGESPYLTNLKIMQAKEKYQDILDRYNTQTLLIPSGSSLDLDIQNSKTLWNEIYRDEVSVIYLK
ncbi:hypothetical protein HYT02_02210 [Candidatus Gottesmanbacteria bacterium]|nr:hypothetical protein [Candidatus Gottesmanbacteria bacterium]